MELRTALQAMPYMDRLDYVSMLSNELVYVECYEYMLSIAVSTHVMLHRVLLVECSRVQNHLLNIACHAGDVGCLVALLWLFEDREALYELVASISGARMHACCIVPGGVRTHVMYSMLDTIVEHMHAMCNRIDALLYAVVLHRV